MAQDLKIGKEALITVEWSVLPVDYSIEKRENLREKMAQKYNVPVEHVKINPNFITLNKNGEKEALTNETIENIQDPKFQHELFKRYLEENGIEDYDFDGILNIDSQINALIDYEVYDKFKRYEIRWIKWSNFLSYGDDNFFDFTQLNGLVLLNGEPANQSGKSTFAYDLLHFLLFGKTASGKADVLSDIFNRYRPETTDVKVEGCIMIDGEEYIIRRNLSRPSFKKRTAKSKVTQKVEYFKIVEGEEQELTDVENLEGSTNTQTTKIIKDAIGNEKDFDLVICANADNLKSLISLKDTERGRLLSKWIGLLPLEEKDILARERWNKEISPRLISNVYNRESIKAEIAILSEKHNETGNEIIETCEKLKAVITKIGNLSQEKETLLAAKGTVDESLSKVDVHTIESSIQSITEKGKNIKLLKEKTEKELENIKNIEFSENEYQDLVSKKEYFIILNNNLKHEINNLRETNKRLSESEYCPTCKRKLEGVDYSETIKENEDKITKAIESGVENKKSLDEITLRISEMDEMRKIYSEKNRLSILVEKYDSDLQVLRSQLKDYNRTLKDLETNKTIIENNNKIELSLNIVNASLQTESQIGEGLLQKQAYLKQEKERLAKDISDREDIIVKIDQEEKLIKSWKIYLMLVGKNGISKMVLRQTLPLINGELRRLLDGVCDFDVDVVIDDHNDVAFNLVRTNGDTKVISNLASGSGFEQTAAALALRVVLGNISTLSRPSILLLDEVLGGVAEMNYENIKLLYDRIIKDYSAVFHITHLNQIMDWHTAIVTVKKENNVSSISCKI
jgi:DNA repair exonuclease SbcCD ATPase subunit